MGGLKRETTGQTASERFEKRTFGLDELDAHDRPCRLRVAEVREETDALLLHEQRGVRALESDEVLDALRVRHEQSLGKRLAQPIDACVHAFTFS